MTTVSSKEAIILAYLAKHRDISVGERQQLVQALKGRARELASQIELEQPKGDAVAESLQIGPEKTDSPDREQQLASTP